MERTRISGAEAGTVVMLTWGIGGRGFFFPQKKQIAGVRS